MNKMTIEEAQACVVAIKAHITDARALVLDLYERKGWQALGYNSWDKCVEGEFSQTKNYLYRLLNAAKVEQNISAAKLPIGNLATEQQRKPIAEAVLRPMAKLEPGQQKQVWEKVTSNGKHPKAKDVQKAIDELPPKPKKRLTESREARVARHRRRVEINGLPEVLAALDADEIAPAMAETIANLPQEYQLAKLDKEKHAYAKKKARVAPKVQSPEVEVKTGKSLSPEDHIPAHLLGGIITGEMLVRGQAVSKDDHGDWCVLPSGVSKLQRDEEVATMIGGSSALEDRKAYYKWQDYKGKNISERILKVLGQIGPIHIPKVFKHSAATYQYNLGISTDLKELVEMVHADLMRRVNMLENQERFGHLYLKQR